MFLDLIELENHSVMQFLMPSSNDLNLGFIDDYLKIYLTGFASDGASVASQILEKYPNVII